MFPKRHPCRRRGFSVRGMTKKARRDSNGVDNKKPHANSLRVDFSRLVDEHFSDHPLRLGRRLRHFSQWTFHSGAVRLQSRSSGNARKPFSKPCPLDKTQSPHVCWTFTMTAHGCSKLFCSPLSQNATYRPSVSGREGGGRNSKCSAARVGLLFPLKTGNRQCYQIERNVIIILFAHFVSLIRITSVPPRRRCFIVGYRHFITARSTSALLSSWMTVMDP